MIPKNSQKDVNPNDNDLINNINYQLDDNSIRKYTIRNDEDKEILKDQRLN